MFKIHKKVKYALIALRHVSHAPKDRLVTAKEICHQHDIPFDPTSRVLQLMSQHGVLEAAQGVHGGYRLSADLGRLSIYELSRMVVGTLAVSDCSADRGSCERLDRCVLKGAMGKLNERVIEAFKGVSVQEMI